MRNQISLIIHIKFCIHIQELKYLAVITDAKLGLGVVKTQAQIT